MAAASKPSEVHIRQHEQPVVVVLAPREGSIRDNDIGRVACLVEPPDHVLQDGPTATLRERLGFILVQYLERRDPVFRRTELGQFRSRRLRLRTWRDKLVGIVSAQASWEDTRIPFARAVRTDHIRPLLDEQQAKDSRWIHAITGTPPM